MCSSNESLVHTHKKMFLKLLLPIARSRDASTSNVCANLYTANVLVILMSPKLANDLYYIIILKWSNYS